MSWRESTESKVQMLALPQMFEDALRRGSEWRLSSSLQPSHPMVYFKQGETATQRVEIRGETHKLEEVGRHCTMVLRPSLV